MAVQAWCQNSLYITGRDEGTSTEVVREKPVKCFPKIPCKLKTSEKVNKINKQCFAMY